MSIISQLSVSHATMTSEGTKLVLHIAHHQLESIDLL